jgi:hypothetical protein
VAQRYLKRSARTVLLVEPQPDDDPDEAEDGAELGASEVSA